MSQELGKAIQELSLRMRMLKVSQEDRSNQEELTDRDVMILMLLNDREKMTVSEIVAADATASSSTISTAITHLWRDKKMVSKTISPKSQRVTIVELTEKGKKAVETVLEQRSERFGSLLKAIQVTDDEEQILVNVCRRASKFMDKHFGFRTNNSGT